VVSKAKKKTSVQKKAPEKPVAATEHKKVEVKITAAKGRPHAHLGWQAPALAPRGRGPG